MVASVLDEPEVRILGWHFVSVENALGISAIHLLGIHAETHRGRITTAVADVDMYTRTVQTASGRIYHLEGEADPMAAAQTLVAYAEQRGIPLGHVALAGTDEVARSFAPVPQNWN